MLSRALGSEQWLPVAVIVLSPLLTAAYFLPILFRAFLVEPRRAHAVGAAAIHDGEHNHEHGEAPFPMVLALTITAAATLVLFLKPDIPLALAKLMLAGGAP